MTTQSVIARLGTSRGNLPHDEVLYNVMLSSANIAINRVQNKFTCSAEAEQGRGTQASPRWLCTINAVSCRLYVILSATKDLKVCTTIHCLGDLEILHSVQNDRVSIQNDNTERHCEDFSPWQSLP